MAAARREPRRRRAPRRSGRAAGCPPKVGDWDLRLQLAEQPRAQWKVATFAGEMKIGDVVYLWESGPNAALLARCQLTSKPAVQPLRPELRPYVRNPKYLEEIRRAGLLVECVVQPELPRAELIKHPQFADLPPIGGPAAARQGTNFSVPPAAANLLARLVDQNGATAA